jgi:hypothetical protein
MAVIPSAAAATAAYKQAVTAKRIADFVRASAPAKPFDRTAWEGEQERLARERAAALPVELAQARKEYMEYLRELIEDAIHEDTTCVGYWDLHDGAMKKRTVALEEFRCEKKHCCGEEYDGEPAMLDWTFRGLNTISSWALLWPSAEHAVHLGRPIFAELAEELEALGYTVEYGGESGENVRFQITYPV